MKKCLKCKGSVVNPKKDILCEGCLQDSVDNLKKIAKYSGTLAVCAIMVATSVDKVKSKK